MPKFKVRVTERWFSCAIHEVEAPDADKAREIAEDLGAPCDGSELEYEDTESYILD